MPSRGQAQRVFCRWRRCVDYGKRQDHRVIEGNAFGDLLPGLTSDDPRFAGQTVYEAIATAASGPPPRLDFPSDHAQRSLVSRRCRRSFPHPRHTSLRRRRRAVSRGGEPRIWRAGLTLGREATRPGQLHVCFAPGDVRWLPSDQSCPRPPPTSFCPRL